MVSVSSPVEDSPGSLCEDSLCGWVGESLMELLSSFSLSVSSSISSLILSMRAALVAGGNFLDQGDMVQAADFKEDSEIFYQL